MSTILLVDDETQILEILSSYLQKGGFHVMTAESWYKGYEVGIVDEP